MITLEFETSKGRFVVFNAVTDDFDGFKYKTNYYFKGRIIKLSEITEEQASDIIGFQYMDAISKPTAIESLHSLLKSKGIHLFENPVPLLHHSRLEAEQKTFYNPYIFKL